MQTSVFPRATDRMSGRPIAPLSRIVNAQAYAWEVAAGTCQRSAYVLNPTTLNELNRHQAERWSSSGQLSIAVGMGGATDRNFEIDALKPGILSSGTTICWENNNWSFF